MTTIVGNPDGGGPVDLAKQRVAIESDGGVGVNVALLIGHGSVRSAVIGAANRAPTADELAKMPTYYIMDLADGMAETVAKEMPSSAEIAANMWLPEAEMKVYSGEYGRTGFQGGLNWYRVRTSGRFNAELELFSGRTIDVPSTFISGASDWGIHQGPGALERMQKVACTNMKEIHLIPGAGHWVQQEKPDEVNRLLLEFLAKS